MVEGPWGMPASRRRQASAGGGWVAREVSVKDSVQNGTMHEAPPQDSSLSQRLQSAREQVLAVAHRHGARNLRIYGSVARCQDRPGSDLDLLVDLERGCSLLEVIALRQELEALLQCQVDLAEVHQLHPLIRDQVLAEATAL